MIFTPLEVKILYNFEQAVLILLSRAYIVPNSENTECPKLIVGPITVPQRGLAMGASANSHSLELGSIPLSLATVLMMASMTNASTMQKGVIITAGTHLLVHGTNQMRGTWTAPIAMTVGQNHG